MSRHSKKQRTEEPHTKNPSREPSSIPGTVSSSIHSAKQYFPPTAPSAMHKWLLAAAIVMLAIWLAYLLVMVMIK